MLDTIIVAFLSLASLFTLGVYVYTTMIYEKPLPSDTQQMLQMMEESKDRVFADAYKMDKLTINLPSRSSRLRFLDVEMHLVPFNATQHSILEGRTPLIKDTIIEIVGDMKPHELNTTVGKILLESRIKKQINRKLGEKVIKDIYYSRFVVQ